MIMRCLGCGGALVYDVNSNMMMCEHCASFFSIEEFNQYSERDDETANQAMNGGENSSGGVNGNNMINPENVVWDELSDEDSIEYNVYRCTGCGAELVLMDTESSSFCAYCGQPSCVMEKIVRQKKPDFILPFSITKNEAEYLIRKKISKSFFVPKEVREFEIEKLHGIYIPYKIYNIEYKDEQILTGLEGSSKNTRRCYYYRYAETFFRGVSCDASVMLNDESSARLEPFDFSSLVKFDKSYLSGFYSNVYDEADEKSRLKAKMKAKRMFDKKMKDSVKAREVKLMRNNPCVKIVSESFVMLPAWFISFRINGENNTIMVNGQTGKCVGAVETDVVRERLVFAGLSIALFPVTNWLCTCLMDRVDMEHIVFLIGAAVFFFLLGRKYKTGFKKSRRLTVSFDMNKFANDRQEGNK